jgi:hypothetical protein
MATSYYKIASYTVDASGTTSVNFTSIPATYKDLKIVWSARTNNSGSYTNSIGVTLNGTTSGYQWIAVYGSNGSMATSRNTSATDLYVGESNGALSTSGIFNNGETYIPNYLSSTNKALISYTATEHNGTPGAFMMNGDYAPITSAVTSLSVRTYGGSSDKFVEGSTFYLYGIKNS